MIKILLEIWMMKALLMRPQIEVRSKVLEMGIKTDCISYFSTAVIKIPMTQSNLRKKGFIFVYGSWGMESMILRKPQYGRRSRKLPGHISSTHRKGREGTGSGLRLETLKAHSQWHTSSSSKAPPPKVSITSPNSTTDWGPSVQLHEPLGTFLIQTVTSLQRGWWNCAHGQGLWKADQGSLVEGISKPNTEVVLW